MLRSTSGAASSHRCRLLGRDLGLHLIDALQLAVERDAIDFAMGDPAKNLWWWGADEVTGCGRAVWCGYKERESDHERYRTCEQPMDFDVAAAQLAIDTQCPNTQIQAEARQVFIRREWIPSRQRDKPDEVKMQISWRLAACGRSYTCSVVGGPAPSVNCKAALDSAAPPPVSPPPPPPSTP